MGINTYGTLCLMGHHSTTEISDAELARLAELANLHLPEELSARRKLADQLGNILGYVAMVQQYKVGDGSDDVDPVRARADEPVANQLGQPGTDGRPTWLIDAPAAEGQLVAVPALFTDRGNKNGNDNE
jgi:Asp-tRNA(Asn)/Glu-tRNA(Gln) amidotransferase C subunit